MERSASLDQLADRAGCPLARLQFRLDCLVRYLLRSPAGDSADPRSPADLPPAADVWQRALALGLAPAAVDLVVEAGIGRLRITPTEVDWRPVVAPTRAEPSPAPQPAPDPVRIARLAACEACSRFAQGRCTIAGCGCAGQGQPSALFSRCPLGLWPSTAGAPADPTR
jgi:hypothetical protein